MWDHGDYEEAKEQYQLSGFVLIYLGIIKVIVALLAMYFGIESVIFDPISVVLLGALCMALGIWMCSDDAL